MIYIVELHYYRYIFTDEYQAIKFAQMAVQAAEEGEEVRLIVRKDNRIMDCKENK